jgi:hypothetical protein
MISYTLLRLEDLISRVRAATGPDAQIDRDMAIDLLDWSGYIQTPTRNVHEKMLGYTGTAEAPVLSFAAWPEPVTASIDQGLVLLHRVLPGWLWRVASCSVTDDAWVFPDFNDPVHGGELVRRYEQAYPGRDPSEAIMEATDVARHPPGQPALAFVESILLGIQIDLTVGLDEAT